MHALFTIRCNRFIYWHRGPGWLIDDGTELLSIGQFVSDSPSETRLLACRETFLVGPDLFAGEDGHLSHLYAGES